jgi:hypothetical protein
MRSLFVISLVLFVSLSSFGQRRNKVDPKDLQIDSLNQVSSALTLQLDSVSKDLNKYLGVYTTLIDEVFHYDFDPAKTSFLIDSLRTTRDSTFTTATNILQDSLLLIKNENMSLQATLDSLSLVLEEAAAMDISNEEKDEAIEDLKQLKELLDTEIISQEEFENKKAKLLEKL